MKDIAEAKDLTDEIAVMLPGTTKLEKQMMLDIIRLGRLFTTSEKKHENNGPPQGRTADRDK